MSIKLIETYGIAFRIGSARWGTVIDWISGSNVYRV